MANLFTIQKGECLMKKSPKNLSLVLLSVLFLFILSFASFAGTWKQDTKGYWYENDDGSYPKSTWMWIPGKDPHIAYCYYFDENGYCLLNRKSPDGYQLSPSGEWLIDRVNLPATKVVNTGNVDANGLPHIACMLYYSLWDMVDEPSSLSVDFPKWKNGNKDLYSIFNHILVPSYVKVYFPSFYDKYVRKTKRSNEYFFALSKEELKKAAKDLFNLQNVDYVWNNAIRRDSNSEFSIIDSNKRIFGIGDWGEDDPFYTADSVSIENTTYTIKGHLGSVLEEDESVIKHSYTIVAKENPESDFGHLTVISLNITKN